MGDPSTRYLVTLDNEEFARLPPAHRALYNHLRRQLRRTPMPEPADAYVVPPEVLKNTVTRQTPFDNTSPLARAIVNGGDPGGHLWQKLLAATEAALAAEAAGNGTKRPAHRRKTESRKIAAHATMRLLGVWD